MDRLFDANKGDRVARVNPRDINSPTKDLQEAFVYAQYRALKMGKRQYLKRHAHRDWWLVFNTEIPLKEKK